MAAWRRISLRRGDCEASTSIGRLWRGLVTSGARTSTITSEGGLMKRRSMLAGLAAAGLDLEAQTNSSAAESLYIPKPQLVEDRKLLHDFMDEFSFVDLVTADSEIRITHIPMILDREAGKFGTIYGHVSRQNPQSKTFASRQPAVIV